MGLLVTTLIWALFVAATLWFPFRRGPLGFAVFVVTMAFNEIPLVLLVVFVASVVASVGDAAADGGSRASRGGARSLAASSRSGSCGCRFAREAFARRSTRRWTASLGADWRASLRPEFGMDAAPPTPWGRGILLPFQRHLASVERVRNRALRHRRTRAPARHLSSEGRRRRRPDRPTGRPVLIHLHGGGFVQGGKSRESVTLLNQLADHGWICVSANYGLQIAGKFPAVTRRHETSDRLGARPCRRARRRSGSDLPRRRVGRWPPGDLGCAHARATRGSSPDSSRPTPASRGRSPLYGYLGPRSSDPASSPAALARSDAPPIMIVHGARDTAIPPARPRTRSPPPCAPFRTRRSSTPSCPTLSTTFDFFASVRARVAANAVEAFLDWARARESIR